MFGVKPLLGCDFLPEEETPGARRVVVISYELWTQPFERNPAVLGQRIPLENFERHSYEIIGVMPEGFRQSGADVWVSCAYMPRPMTRRGGEMLHVVARLKPGVTLAHAQSEMSLRQARIHSEFGHLERQGHYLAIGPQIRLQPLLESMDSNVRPSLLIFLRRRRAGLAHRLRQRGQLAAFAHAFAAA